MKFSKFLMFTLLCSVLILSACGEDETVNADKNNEPEVKKDAFESEQETASDEEIVDPYPKNTLSTEVDIVMEDFNFALLDFQVNINEYMYGYNNSSLEDYQKKALIETGEIVNERMNNIELSVITDGDKEMEYLFEELKKYQNLRFQAMKKYLEQPNDNDFEIFNTNSTFASDISIKMLDIRGKDLE